VQKKKWLADFLGGGGSREWGYVCVLCPCAVHLILFHINVYI